MKEAIRLAVKYAPAFTGKAILMSEKFAISS